MTQYESSAGEPRDVLQGVAHSYDAHDIVIIDGMVNHVGLIDERFVVKVPKSKDSADSLVTEAAALELLKASSPLSVNTPELVQFSTDPPYLVSTYLPGSIIEAPDLYKLSARNREALGHEIGTYVLTQATEIDITVACRRLPSNERSDSWNTLFEAGVGNFSSKSYVSLSKVAKQLYTVWTAYQAEKVDTQFTQGDLRLGNMVVSADNQLAGVFDFGRAGIGDPSYELSPLANIDLTILAGAIDELQTGGLDINREHIQLWENMRDTLKLTYAVTGEATPSFIAKALLKIPACFPELDWSELDQLSSSSSRSPRITKPSNK